MMKPPGIIQPFAGASAPTGYLLCDGTSYLRTDYPLLFAIVGTKFGSIDGTHFTVPDLRGKTIFGYDVAVTNFNTVGKTGGAKTASLAHTHTDTSHTHDGYAPTSGSSAGTQLSNDTGAGQALHSHYHDMGVSLAAGGANGSNSQLSATQAILNPFLTLNYIIKI